MTQTIPPTVPPTVPPGVLATVPPVASGALTHPGQVRPANEDGVLAAPGRGFWAVTDGMGGHVGGAEAAAAVVAALDALPRAAALGTALDDIEGALRAAGRRIAARAAAMPGAVIGATAVALAIRGRDWGCLWAGDSRAYRLHRGRLEQLTRDHTEANDLLDAGVITAEEARTWPRRNVITRAVGVSEPLVLDRVTGRMAPGDRFVLCSDGLMKHVADDEIAGIVTAEADAGAAARALLDLTLARGARDNVTVVVVAAPPGPDDLPGPDVAPAAGGRR